MAMKPGGGNRTRSGSHALELYVPKADAKRAMALTPTDASVVRTTLQTGLGSDAPSVGKVGAKKRPRARRVAIGYAELDSSGELRCTVRGKPAQVAPGYEAVLRKGAAAGPVMVRFHIVAYDAASGSFDAVPKGFVGRPGRLRLPPAKVDKKRDDQLPRKVRSSGLRPYRGSGIVSRTYEPRIAVSPARQPETATMLRREDISEVARKFIEGSDAGNIFDAVRRASADGQYGRISCLAEFLFDIDERLEGERAIACYKRLLPEADTLGFGEVKPIVLHEIAKIAKRLGRRETAASYALGAARHALENGEHVIAKNLLRESQRLEIL